MKPSITSAEEVSRGQKDTCITLITDATRKATGVALDELIESGVLNKQNIEKVRARGNEVVAAITALVKKKFAELAENVDGCLKLISGAEILILDPTDGTGTIANAKDLFTGWLDPDFENYGTNVVSLATGKVEVIVYEMIKDGDFKSVFGSLADDLNTLCFTQTQIIQFVEKHRKWLRTDGFATFFLFKVGNMFFVARVRVHSAG